MLLFLVIFCVLSLGCSYTNDWLDRLCRVSYNRDVKAYSATHSHEFLSFCERLHYKPPNCIIFISWSSSRPSSTNFVNGQDSTMSIVDSYSPYWHLSQEVTCHLWMLAACSPALVRKWFSNNLVQCSSSKCCFNCVVIYWNQTLFDAVSVFDAFVDKHGCRQQWYFSY